MATILVVDDEEADRLAFRTALERSGHAVVSAKDGVAAIHAFLERTVHAVVTDLVMPDGDGIDLITALKRIKPDVVVVAVSGKGRSGLSVAESLGADRIFEKPVAGEVLAEAVKLALTERGLVP